MDPVRPPADLDTIPRPVSLSPKPNGAPGGWAGIPIWPWVAGLGTLCLLPGLAVHLGVDLSTRVEPFPQSGVGGLTPGQIALAVQAVARGSYTHTLLEWTAFCAASFVCLLTFVQYRLTREPSLPIIGVALLCAGAMDAFHTLVADGLITAVGDRKDLIPFTWALCRMFNGLILLTGLALVTLSHATRDFLRDRWALLGTSVAFVACAYIVIYFCATAPTLPQTMFPDAAIKRPYDIFPIVPFALCALLLYFGYLRYQPTAFGRGLLLSMIPAIAAQLYMVFGSDSLHDSSFNIAHSLKVVSYLAPIIGLVVEWRRTRPVLRARSPGSPRSRVRRQGGYSSRKTRPTYAPLSGRSWRMRGTT